MNNVFNNYYYFFIRRITKYSQSEYREESPCILDGITPNPLIVHCIDCVGWPLFIFFYRFVGIPRKMNRGIFHVIFF